MKYHAPVADLLLRIESSIAKRALLKRGQALLVGVSGGLDSMVLLHALHQLSARHHWRLTVAHFNHQLRGRSSDADERLVRKTAAVLKLPVVVDGSDVKKFARQSQLSLEMAARKLRHEFFARVASERKVSTIALAHHADDQVELFFLRVLRGTGNEGLAGMKWRAPSPANQKLSLIRPLLDAGKDELRDFARTNKIAFREDATNASLNVPRNRIRNQLLPLLRKDYQPGLTRTVLRLMELAGGEAEVAGDLALHWLKRRQPAFNDLRPAVQRRVLQSQLLQLSVPGDFELIEALRRSPDQAVSIDSKLSVLRNAAGKVNLQTSQPLGFNAEEAQAVLGRAGGLSFAGVELSWQVTAGKGFARPPSQTGCEIFDADQIGRQIRLRHWRAGDRFQPIGLKTAAKLQDLFTNAKIPREQRRRLIVATRPDGEIFWVEGLRMAERFKLTPQTMRRLTWRWQPA